MNGFKKRSALIPAAGAVAMWSTVATAFKLALREMEPMDLVVLASVVSWAALGGALLIRRLTAGFWFSETSNITPRTVFLSGLIGLLNPVFYYAVLFAAYDRLPAQAAQPLNYTWPVFLALLAAPMAGRKPTVREMISLAFGLAGIVLISYRSEGAEGLDPVGVALALGSGLIWAVYWLLGTRLSIDGLLRLFIGFSAALIPLLPFWFLRGAPFPSVPISCFSVVWVGLFEMGLTFLLWNTALSRAERPARIGSLVYLGPFLSLVWIALILHETIRPVSVAGLAVIIAGVLISREKPREENEVVKGRSC